MKTVHGRIPQNVGLRLLLVIWFSTSFHGNCAVAQRHTNRLAQETSPYLLQHAHNPVNWYPWGEEALQRAQDEGKLIFLSIGYSSCHWCHVMERESFIDEEIANFLNKHFVCIKVDREERPDVDSIYMVAVQIINRNGGWPLSIFLTPDAKPFFGGTYFPARDNDRPGTVGFLTVAQKVNETWQQEEKQVVATGDQVAKILREHFSASPSIEPIELNSELLDRMQSRLAVDFDEQWGGFGYSDQNPKVPKFPTTSNLLFLLKRAELGNQDAGKMLQTTLDRMAMGGIWDHVGGGFHRYSTDRFWHIPHFEKMLYDNAQLITVFARASKLFQNDEYAHVVDRISEFLRRELTDKSGGFYAALDADSEGEEGAYYRWTRSQLDAALGPADAKRLGKLFWPGGKNNFDQEFIVPLRSASWNALAKEQQGSSKQLIRDYQPLLEELLVRRNKRKRPLTDTKILTSWNGLMIQGLAESGRELERPELTQMAANAASFLLTNLMDEKGRLRRTYTNGEARLNAYLDDYAFLAAGLLSLHQTTLDERWISAAQRLMAMQDELFTDPANGGYFFTSKDHENLIVRGKLLVDNARPSGVAVSAENLLYLANFTGDDSYRQKAIRTIQSASQILQDQPISATRLGYAIALLVESS